MNIVKLKTSFLVLIAMTILQLLISFFIIHNIWIAILSIVALIASICGFFFADRYNQK